MTVVIMARCYDHSGELGPVATAQPWVIAACDTLLSADYETIRDGSVAKIQKAGFLNKWLLGYSGDPAHFIPIRNRLAREIGPFTGNPNAPDSDIKRALERVYLEHRQALIQTSILDPFNINGIEDLKTNGLRQFGEACFNDLYERVRDFDLGIDLLLSGFNKINAIKLFHITHPGIAEDKEIGAGAFSVGMGCFHAQWYLNANYNIQAPLGHAVSRILEAKMIADGAVPSVGPDTNLIAMRSDGSTKHIQAESLERFREHWDRHRRRIPASLVDALELQELYNF